MDTCFGLLATRRSPESDPYALLARLACLMRAKNAQLRGYESEADEYRAQAVAYEVKGQPKECKEKLAAEKMCRGQYAREMAIYTNLRQTKIVLEQALSNVAVAGVLKATSVTLGDLLQGAGGDELQDTIDALVEQMTQVKGHEQMLGELLLPAAERPEEATSSEVRIDIELPSVPKRAAPAAAPKKQLVAN